MPSTLGSRIGSDEVATHIGDGAPIQESLTRDRANRRRLLIDTARAAVGLLIAKVFGVRISTAVTAAGTTVTANSIAALQAAINQSHSGDTIVLADGTYLNNTFDVSTSGISVRAQTPGRVFLNGTNAITISGSGVTFSGFQFTAGSISGFVITVTGSDNLLTQLNFNGYSAQKYINIQAPSRRNEVSYSNFENKPTSAPAGNLIHVGADASVVGYHRIRYCSFQNMQGSGGDNGNEPIRLSNGAQSGYVARTIVEHCYWGNTGPGDSESISVKCRENVIRYCTFTDNPDGMLVFRNGDNNVAYGNFFIRAGGIRVKEANNIYCYNNHFEHSGVGGTMNAVTYDYVSPNLQNINFLHNSFVECGLIDLGGSGPTANTWANNLFTKMSSSPIFANPNGGTSWIGNIFTGVLGISIPSGMTPTADPLLAVNGDGYYGLAAGSPAIDQAVAGYPAVLDIPNLDDDPTLALDISGQTRGVVKDVGCDEFTALPDVASDRNRPLTLADVGPAYLGGPIVGGSTVTVANPGNQTAIVNTAIAPLTIAASDSASGQILTFTATGLPAGLSISPSGVISGAPYSPIVNATVTVTATDTTDACGTTTFAWTVTDTAPNLVSVRAQANQRGAINKAVSLQMSATDTQAQQVMTWSAVGLPAGLTINATTGLISGTPTSAVTGAAVTVTATDTTGALGTTFFSWTVAQVTVTNPGTQTTALSTATSLSIGAMDSAGLALSYSASGLPAGLATNSSTGVISGTTNVTAKTYSVVVTVTDATGASGIASFSWAVKNTVTVTNPGNQSTVKGTPTNLQVNATDSQAGAVLTYSASGLPRGLSIGSNTGRISGTPTRTGTSSVTVTAKDASGAGGTTSFSWKIT